MSDNAWTPFSRRHANQALLDALMSFWDDYPDWRFGQLVMNLSRTDDGFADTWEWTNQQWRERIAALRAELAAPVGLPNTDRQQPEQETGDDR